MIKKFTTPFEDSITEHKKWLQGESDAGRKIINDILAGRSSNNTNKDSSEQSQELSKDNEQKSHVEQLEERRNNQQQTWLQRISQQFFSGGRAKQ